MKTVKVIISIVLITAFIQPVLATTQKIGLYLTINDYLNHKLSFVADGSKIKLKEFFESRNVVVIHEGKKQLLSKSEIFGYRIDDLDYRYFNNTAFRILDTGGFFIYSGSKLVQQGKGPKPIKLYYFSVKPNAEIRPLTMDNLQVVFSKETKFLYAVEGFFKSDNELIAYDPGIKAYKLKYIFSQTTR